MRGSVTVNRAVWQSALERLDAGVGETAAIPDAERLQRGQPFQLRQPGVGDQDETADLERLQGASPLVCRSSPRQTTR